MDNQVQLRLLVKLQEQQVDLVQVQRLILADLDNSRQQLEEINSRLNDMGNDIAGICRKGVKNGK